MFNLTPHGTSEIKIKWNEKYAFNEMTKNPSPELVKLFQKTVDEIIAEVAIDMEQNVSAGLSPKSNRRSIGYYQGNLKGHVISNPKKFITAYVNSTADNSGAYEASHGNLARVIARKRIT